MSYGKEERETIIRTDEIMDHWVVETTQGRMCTKVKKIRDVTIINEELTENGTIIAGQYLLPMKCVSFRNLKETSMKTDEERKILSDRFKAMHTSKKKLIT